MPEHPYQSIWERLAVHVGADPTPGEQRLAGAVQHAQSEPVGEPERCPTCKRYGWFA